MGKFPQVLLNVKVARASIPSTCRRSQAAVRRIEKQLAGEGRVVLRASGTEPVIRVMVEGRDEADVRGCADELAEVVRTRPLAGDCGRPEARLAAPLRGLPRRYHPRARMTVIARPLSPGGCRPSTRAVSHATQNRRRQLEDARLARRQRAR